MDTLHSKRVSDSKTEQVQIVMGEQINGDNRLFGGKLFGEKRAGTFLLTPKLRQLILIFETPYFIFYRGVFLS